MPNCWHNSSHFVPVPFLQPAHMMTGHLQPHSILAILFAIINLKASIRMSLPGLQVASLCYDHEAKAAGMVDVFNGGETSPGAQLRIFQHPHSVTVRSPGHGYGCETRDMTMHAPLFVGDFPATAAMTPAKGSTSAHRCRLHRHHLPYPRLSPSTILLTLALALPSEPWLILNLKV